jgi:hypothetical protein
VVVVGEVKLMMDVLMMVMMNTLDRSPLCLTWLRAYFVHTLLVS